MCVWHLGRRVLAAAKALGHLGLKVVGGLDGHQQRLHVVPQLARLPRRQGACGPSKVRADSACNRAWCVKHPG